MTFKQKLLKAAYPAFMWFSGKKAGEDKIISNDKKSLISFYRLSDTLTNDMTYNFDQLRGKKVLLVNTASNCGYTPQYDALEKLYKQHSDKLIVLGFPSNDFGEQEKANDKSIEKFCKINYGITFPLMKKSNVKKLPRQNVVFKWLSDPQQNGWNSTEPSWNFTKYLIDENGQLTHIFASSVDPAGEEMKKALGL